VLDPHPVGYSVSRVSGDTELNDYMNSLAKDPDKFITPHNGDTGETILHLLAKEGKMEILHNLLEDSRVEKDLVRALLQQVWPVYFRLSPVSYCIPRSYTPSHTVFFLSVSPSLSLTFFPLFK
jgi:hypothetical protein